MAAVYYSKFFCHSYNIHCYQSNTILMLTAVSMYNCLLIWEGYCRLLCCGGKVYLLISSCNTLTLRLLL